MSSDEGFIPYLVLIRFDRGDDLRDRLHESLSLLQGRSPNSVRWNR
jgi:hypothetical protein